MDNSEIIAILQELGTRLPTNSQLDLVGTSALALLVSQRLTIDIDFVGDDVHPTPLHKTIMQIAREMKIHVVYHVTGLFLSQRAVKSGLSASVDLEIWRSLSLTRIASPSVNWIAAWTLILTILFSCSKQPRGYTRIRGYAKGSSASRS